VRERNERHRSDYSFFLRGALAGVKATAARRGLSGGVEYQAWRRAIAYRNRNETLAPPINGSTARQKLRRAASQYRSLKSEAYHIAHLLIKPIYVGMTYHRKCRVKISSEWHREGGGGAMGISPA